ncbi:phosphoenolpyruvate carboxykinase (GTP) [Candidatus Micrarchaeota archaeon]|nr:phosphoenolpyruvate carboxykinase (GTP) [Candidatus Micrarchaeota archaeon]
MSENALHLLKTKLNERSFEKIERIKNARLHEFLAEFIELCNPSKVFVSSSSPEDTRFLREESIRRGEEKMLALEGHTIHFDSPLDQGRDKKNTRILVERGEDLGYGIETKDRDEGLNEVKSILKDIKKGKDAFVLFFCLGPTNSEFSVPCVQFTDSAYVAHSENLLYRHGYDEFVRQGEKADFFKFVHSQGELTEKGVCKNIDKRRVYIDLKGETVYSANTQYGGNSIGLKKLAMRLSIRKADKEGWLLEHMFVMGVNGPKGRRTYILGAFPSLCGKTSTAMLEGEALIGDDITKIRKKGGKVRAANIEKGMFGIIQGVNSKDDPQIWKALHTPGEIIFSNVLVTDEGKVHWIGKDGGLPAKGTNYSGEWWVGKKDLEEKEILCSHPNARFTLDLNMLENLDPRIEDPNGVEVGAIVYGGRDSDTWVPVEQAFGWEHGIITKGASLESETTAATLGKEGVREFNPMSNLDFLSIPIGKYVQNNLEFGKGLDVPVFSVNYFLKDREGKFLNQKTDKRVWYKWMESRIHREVDAIKTPTGFIPKYGDLQRLFNEVLGRDYSKEEYEEQFKIRVLENLAKIDRIEVIYRTQILDAPKRVFEVLDEQRKRLEQAREKHGDYISPFELA